MRIGSYELKNRILLAPMAGITDQPFRRLCAHYGAGLTFSEMMSTNPQVWHTEKSKLRLAHSEELGLNAVQIAGSDPLEMAQAAAINVAYGAEIIDINMGCPAKKVCNVLAGSALLQNEPLVEAILNAVVVAVVSMMYGGFRTVLDLVDGGEDLSLVRSALLSGVLTTFTPDLLIIDRHPYGVHQELREPLPHPSATPPPKQPARKGERPLAALAARGVEYIEVRLMDLDPFSAIGITAETTLRSYMGYIPQHTCKKVLDEETVSAENGLSVLATVGATAPFFGLFGTVWGVYHALVNIGLSGSGRPGPARRPSPRNTAAPLAKKRRR